MLEETELQDEIVDLYRGGAIVAAPEIRALRIIQSQRPADEESELLRVALRLARLQRFEARIEAQRLGHLATVLQGNVKALNAQVDELRTQLRAANTKAEQPNIPAYWMELSAGIMDRWADFHPSEFEVACEQSGFRVWNGDGIEYQFQVRHLASGLRSTFKVSNTDTKALRAESALRTVVEMIKLKEEAKRRERANGHHEPRNTNHQQI